MKNIFVIGLNDFHRSLLERTPQAEEVKFHRLLTMDRVRTAKEIPVARALEEATEQLEKFEGSIDGVIGYWDFPVNQLVAMLCERFDLPSAPIDRVMMCEHKLWSRIAQKKAVPEVVPRFERVDPFADDPRAAMELEYPFWIKPVIGYSSTMAHKVESNEDMERAVRDIRKRIGRFADPTDWVLERCECLPEDLELNGRLCVAEGLIGGRQCTVEGYTHEGKVSCYGVIDSLRFKGVSSFSSYRYPPLLPESAQRRIIETSERVMSHIDLAEQAFNIEYFWDEGTDEIRLLEINARPSQSHSDLFAKVDGATNKAVMVDLALGRRPKMPKGEGDFGAAGKFYLRHFEDAQVTRVPSQEEIDAIKEDYPGTWVNIEVNEGDVLSEGVDQDSYSYELGYLYLGAKDHDELRAVYEDCRDRLTFDFEPVEAGVR